MESTPKRSGRFALFLTALVAFVWPPIYSLFIHPDLTHVVDSSQPSTGELQRLLDARRYVLRVPPECDGWYLSLESVVDGVARPGSASTVPGDSEITLLVRRTGDTKKIEYCWFTENQLSRGLLDDPLVNAGVMSDRSPGVVRSGDWLFRGGRTSISSVPDIGADFEVRVTLRPPRQDTDT